MPNVYRYYGDDDDQRWEAERMARDEALALQEDLEVAHAQTCELLPEHSVKECPEWVQPD